MNTYNTGKMRQGATDIAAAIKSYNEAKDTIDQLVNQLRNNWQDETNSTFSGKYTNEAKVSAENVSGLMNQFVQLLNSTADAYEKVHNQAQNDMR